jgi:hypothetical protein
MSSPVDSQRTQYAIVVLSAAKSSQLFFGNPGVGFLSLLQVTSMIGFPQMVAIPRGLRLAAARNVMARASVKPATTSDGPGDSK